MAETYPNKILPERSLCLYPQPLNIYRNSTMDKKTSLQQTHPHYTEKQQTFKNLQVKNGCCSSNFCLCDIFECLFFNLYDGDVFQNTSELIYVCPLFTIVFRQGRPYIYVYM